MIAIPETHASTTPDSLLIIAGWGDFPRLVADGAHAAGVKRVSVLGFKGSTLRSTCRAVDDFTMIPFGNLDLVRKSITESGCKKTVLAGQINPLCLFSSRMDKSMLSELAKLKLRNAHTIFHRFIEDIENLGVEVLPSSLFMKNHIPTEGVLTARAPDERENGDIVYGNRIAMEICNHDIGQTVVVKDGVVLAVEGFDGTNVTIKRGGNLVRRGAVVIKVAKNGHDMRFDIPIIGTKTVGIMKASGISALSIQARRTIVLNLPRVVEAANRAGIALVAVKTDLLPAPTL